MNFGSDEEELTTAQLVERQLEIEEAARQKFPWDPKECTLYLDIAPRQLLFTCLTCRPQNAICYSCGLRCHADHNIVELDTKREFRCDCGTTRLPGSYCCLRRTDEVDNAPNTHLTYGQNFNGKFCVCGESCNDPDYGESAMIQCLMGTRCNEDWFHARCICGVSRATEKQRQAQLDCDSETDHVEADKSNPIEAKDEQNGLNEAELGAHEIVDQDMDEEVTDDDEGDDDMTAMFPELPASFGALVCPECLKDVAQLRQSEAVVGEVNGYLFLANNYTKILGADPNFKRIILRYPFLGTREQSYRPQRDEDTTTLLEAGERALQRAVPHEMVVDGMSAFNNMQNRLIAYLREIGSEDRAFTKDDIESFFRTFEGK